MTYDKNRGAAFSLPSACILLVFLIACYALSAQVFGLWPLSLPPPAVCPSTALGAEVFVDPTASNPQTNNRLEEAHAFAQSLDSCAQVSFWMINNNSSGGSAYGDLLRFPQVDPNAPGAIRLGGASRGYRHRQQPLSFY